MTISESSVASRPASSELLHLQGIEAAYGESKVLFGVDFGICAGECVSLLGRNGMGKSTTVKTIMGLHPFGRGDITFAGRSLKGLKSYQVSRLGIGLVPEGRRVFPNLSVQENLVATARPPEAGAQGWLLDDVYGTFPRLKERRGHLGCNLSGGEQQMLAIGRALMTNPRLLILDEATEGLAPIIRKDIWDCVKLLKSRGLALLIIDKNLGALKRVADHHYVLEKGRVVWHGTSDDLSRDVGVVKEHIGM